MIPAMAGAQAGADVAAGRGGVAGGAANRGEAPAVEREQGAARR